MKGAPQLLDHESVNIIIADFARKNKIAPNLMTVTSLAAAVLIGFRQSCTVIDIEISKAQFQVLAKSKKIDVSPANKTLQCIILEGGAIRVYPNSDANKPIVIARDHTRVRPVNILMNDMQRYQPHWVDKVKAELKLMEEAGYVFGTVKNIGYIPYKPFDILTFMSPKYFSYEKTVGPCQRMLQEAVETGKEVLGLKRPSASREIIRPNKKEVSLKRPNGYFPFSNLKSQLRDND